MSVVDYVAGLSKPKSAPTIDGVYLEDIIPGYRTLSAEGREPLDFNVTSVDRDKMDGDIYRWEKLNARTITIHYAISVDSLSTYHNSFNTLKSYIYAHPNAKYVFNDESDKYIVGTVESLTEEDLDGSGSDIYVGRGEISVRCSDPIKYSVKEYSQTSGDDGVVSFNYDGTYPAYPTISVKMKNRTKLDHIDRVTIVNQDGAILTFGESIVSSETKYMATRYTCMNYGNEFNSGISGDSLQTLLSKGAANNDANNRWWMSNGYGGAVQDGSIEYQVTGGNQILHPSNFGTSGTDTWIGTCLRWDIGEFPDGTTSTTDFFLKFESVLIAQSSTQVGGQYVGVEDENGKQIMGMQIIKNNDTTDKYTVFYYVGNTSIARIITCAKGGSRNYTDNVSSGTGQRGWHSQHSLQKSGERLIFHFAEPQSFNGKSLASTKAKYVVLGFTKLRGNWLPMAVNGLEYLYFEGNYAKGKTQTRTTTTYLTTQDELVTNCADASTRVNGMLKTGMAALGNDWSQFKLAPGSANRITARMTKSDDQSEAVGYVVTVKYRKAYL